MFLFVHLGFLFCFFLHLSLWICISFKERNFVFFFMLLFWKLQVNHNKRLRVHCMMILVMGLNLPTVSDEGFV